MRLWGVFRPVLLLWPAPFLRPESNWVSVFMGAADNRWLPKCVFCRMWRRCPLSLCVWVWVSLECASGWVLALATSALDRRRLFLWIPWPKLVCEPYNTKNRGHTCGIGVSLGVVGRRRLPWGRFPASVSGRCRLALRRTSTLIIWCRWWERPLGRCLSSSVGHGDENWEESEALVMCPGKSLEMEWRAVRGMDGYERAGMGSTSADQSLSVIVIVRPTVFIQ